MNFKISVVIAHTSRSS